MSHLNIEESIKWLFMKSFIKIVNINSLILSTLTFGKNNKNQAINTNRDKISDETWKVFIETEDYEN